MNPGSNTESYPVFARIGLRENPGKNLNQVTCPDQDSNPGHLVSRPDALTVTAQSLTWSGREFQRRGIDMLKDDKYDLSEVCKAKPESGPRETNQGRNVGSIEKTDQNITTNNFFYRLYFGRSHAVASWSKASCLGLALRNTRGGETREELNQVTMVAKELDHLDLSTFPRMFRGDVRGRQVKSARVRHHVETTFADNTKVFRSRVETNTVTYLHDKDCRQSLMASKTLDIKQKDLCRGEESNTVLLFLIREPRGRYLICSDSLSAIQSLQCLYSEDPLVLRTQQLFHTLLSSDCEIGVVWIPGHVGIRGNEAADAAAKDGATNGTLVYWRERWQDLQNYLKCRIWWQWEGEWSAQEENKLRRIKNTVRVWDSSTRASRHEEVLLTRLRIGHCYLTHGHLLRGELQPECDMCHVPLTVEHFLLHCRKYDRVRRQYGIRPTLRDALGNDFNCTNAVLRFLSSTGLDRVI
ncbi:hypothetical protein ANN_20385 [Periplaneta americana]|uniref:RNase H type-1 domain-containing protein n=1 Tax=Periplaneta americana TaxID=6978 RepID=A0ABQ8SD95_PERAM|nr:hypothetical protein ANN_20385 [Periplaneta americana]